MSFIDGPRGVKNGKTRDMKVVSWNIWVDCHFDKLKDFLNASNADVIGLQEVKDDDPERDVIGFLTDLGYQHVFARTEQVWDGKVYRHGPAVFSRLPIVHSETYVLDVKDERAAARADININGKTVHVFSTHLKHTHQQPSESQELQAESLLEKLSANNTIVMGDFNATPDSASIQAMNKILVDTDSASAPTWSMYPEGCLKCSPQAVDTRLDYIFVSKDLKTHSFGVGQSKASDHLPISVEVEV